MRFESAELPDEFPIICDGVKLEPLQPGRPLPLLVQSLEQDTQLGDWLEDHISLVEAALLTHCAVLFRGFGPLSVQAFQDISDSLIAEHLPHVFRLTKRPVVAGNVYEPTLHPPELCISIHNECAAQRRWPRRVIFGCVVPARRGGETPLADCRLVLKRLSPEVREKFERLGILYLRDIAPAELKGIFGTDVRTEIESHCDQNGYEFEWDLQGGLHIRFTGRAVQRHPVTDESLWFNYVQFYLVPRYPYLRGREQIEEPVAPLAYKPECYDLHACFGDGSPIDAESARQVHNAYNEDVSELRWQEGDILLLDNMLTAHGRNSFEGERKLLFAMGNPHSDLPLEGEKPFGSVVSGTV